ncbi:MAG: ABC transporter permease [Cyclobacteriaceae bacterium]
MLRNYFITALRLFRKHKLFTFINVLGLTLGLGCSLMIFLWVQDEMGYDRFHTNSEHLYQVIREEVYNNGTYEYLTATPGLMAPALKQDYAEIVNTCRLGWLNDFSVRYKDKLVKQTPRYVDGSFFSMFSYRLLKGDAESIFAHPDEMVITESMAKNIFGNEDPLGQVLEVKDPDFTYSLKITGVLEDFPGNTFVNDIDFFIPFAAFAKNNPWVEGWDANVVELMVQVAPETKVEKLNQSIGDIIKENSDNEQYEIYLQPFGERHLYGSIEPVRKASGRIVYVRLFSVIALFILVIACINFMNLTTARSSTRVQEVGVRKAIGAGRKNLIGQFMSEAILLTLVALVIALVISILFLPNFNQLTGKDIQIPWDQPWFYFTLTLILLLAAAFAGGYPSLYLSAFKPVKVLKGQSIGSGGTPPIRKVLVVFQFTLSIILMIGAWVVYQQIQYFKDKNIGLERENVIYFQSTQEIKRNQEIFASRLTDNQSVQSTSYSLFLPTNVQLSTSSPSWTGKAEEDEVEFQILFTGMDFLETMKIKLREGRDFSSLADSSKILINAAAADLIGNEQLVGKPVTFWDGKFDVIGVFENFNSRTLHGPIAPMIITMFPASTEYVLMRSAPGQASKAISEAKSLFEEFSPDDSFDYHFLDETYQSSYQSEMLVGKLANIFTVLAIVISCLGLFGLAAFNFERRKKETGVRKVLGANITQILYLFSRESLQVILWSLLLAGPVSWWLSTRWLKQFYYHTEFHWSIILIVGIVALLIALLTVGWHAMRAAKENPVKALRYE